MSTGLDPAALGPVVLGGNVFGWTADEATSLAVLDAWFEAGGRAVDTADLYAGTESESILGRWMASRGRRDDVVLCTKVAKAEARRGLDPATVTAAVEDSLRRLQTDHVDLYYAHEDDEAVPQEAYVAAFGALVEAGKVRALGASNFTADRLRRAVALAAEQGVAGFSFAQDHWNLVERDLETDLVPTLLELGIAEVPYFALASGFLTGKHRPADDGDASSGADSRRAGMVQRYLDDPTALARLAALTEVAADRGASPAAVALAWLRQQRTVAAPIASARTPEQLPALLEAFTLTLADDELARLTAAG